EDNLADTWKNTAPLLLIPITKFLTISPLLLLRPEVHGARGHENEEKHAPTETGDEVYAHPGDYFKHVIGAGHPIEAQAMGDTSLGSSWSAEIAQDEMGIEVR